MRDIMRKLDAWCWELGFRSALWLTVWDKEARRQIRAEVDNPYEV